MALPVSAYDDSLSESGIRDAYFLARRDGTHADFLASYTNNITNLKVDSYVTLVQIETPFAQVANAVAQKIEYSAQDAVRDFAHRPFRFKIHLQVCYKPNALPNAVLV